ncbi:hypothetical protein GJ744_011916 [Endocarpon pusillum]|uniref:CBF1-interacting co-repressor CIR N-terminal domain-containing protein n=1 Tax=Endocarpon pusillum TaxID=364733 RepID=A0A8H7APC1_9EURO|nr:hypothetical protein GJ744_011916 [Endocarpon pusillum]
MPLHLLGKKSWNVYNQDNIDRVRRDEADAQDREDEEDRRHQLVDSERRLKLLRGHEVDDLPPKGKSPLPVSRKDDHGHGRKRRRIAGEDDTDRDMRLAIEVAALQARTSGALRTSDEPLTDSQGHIDLFTPRSQHKEKNVEAEAERAKKKREYQDQYTMRFSNAAGFKQGLNTPWYSTASQTDAEIPSKDVWGNDDIGRREREKMRVNANDPLAVMKRGVKQLRDTEKSRKDWKAERERELQELKSLQQEDSSGRSRRKKRRRRGNDFDDFDKFNLDNSPREHQGQDRHYKLQRHRHHSRSRHQS